METLKLKGANLNYHKMGHGPVLICIPGANGTGDIFLPLAKELANDFAIVAVDRRGYGASELTEPLPASAENAVDDYRVTRDAADIAALAEELSDEPVYIMGSSSGSIVAMHVLKNHPEIVKKIAFHEPPINSFLPDKVHWQQKNNEIVDMGLSGDMPGAMQLFGETLHIAPIDEEMMAAPAPTPEEEKIRREEMKNWMKYEIRQYTTSDITVDDLKQYKERITLLNGTDSTGSFPQDVNFYLEKEAGLKLVDIPGGHLGYIQKTSGFAATLKELWQ
ncbi:alpha/beta hydrolase [Macrococcus equipercicus]|uniref:Alpha/beta hydrolase n=1 Tax=Macrococcus equipercicus TaxID=69967 RepID=A0ABQ6R8T5_9STAP|nr:alpha/beta fold hydrolase [Macrococcus equipercicus]KAA1039546.1 alpha/beta hydrolase [Macrococcus equipercicus]